VNDLNKHIDTSKVETKIAEHKLTIEALLASDQPYYDIAKSRSAQDRIATLVAQFPNPDFDLGAFTELCGAATLANSIDDRDRYKATLETRLMHITSDWLVTETEHLISPAGFHASDRVFVATDVQTNCETAGEAMRYSADGTIPLYLHDMSKIAK
jgi:hypothetical protein